MNITAVNDVDKSLPMFPATSQEYINLIAHYYRGEIARMAGWRDRIDRTTNWAITCVAAMISISWSGPSHPHEILLFAMIIVLLLLIIESRRYRFFDVYRRRVRTIERYYYARVFDPAHSEASEWTEQLGRDLRLPIFVISWKDAFCRRLRRNYLWLFLILLAAWLLQIAGFDVSSRQPSSTVSADIIHNASIGALSGAPIIVLVLCFYCVLIVAAVFWKKPHEELFLGNVHV